MTTTGTDVADSVVEDADLRAKVVVRRPQHPALARLHDQIAGGAKPGEITSYDRMHHRHNRS